MCFSTQIPLYCSHVVENHLQDNHFICRYTHLQRLSCLLPCVSHIERGNSLMPFDLWKQSTKNPDISNNQGGLVVYL